MRILVLDPAPKSRGNAEEIGFADDKTQRFFKKVDHSATATNAIIAMTPDKGRIPIAPVTDRGAVQPEMARVVHIKSAIETGELEISAPLLEGAGGRKNHQIMSEAGASSSDDGGKPRRVSFVKP